jgi:hypothetical protein
MKTAPQLKTLGLAGVLACAFPALAHAALIVNGGFESGFTGWTRVDQLGSEGTFALQTGTTSPVNSFAVPAPPGGSTAAMTDAAGPGSHVLYQDFVVAGGLTSYSLELALFVNNTGPNFVTPNTLDFATPALNQRARIDIMTTGANPFSLTAGDVLQSLYETTPGSPLVTGYNLLQFDVTGLLQANQGATLRLRIAQVDNVAPFNLGVDNVDIRVGAAAAVPDSLPLAVQGLTLLGLCVAGAVYRRKPFASSVAHERGI